MTEPVYDRKTHTPQGFLRALSIPADSMDKIMVLVEQGERPGVATRKHGTSVTQFVRRLEKEPALKARWVAMQQQHAANLQSGDGEPAANNNP